MRQRSAIAVFALCATSVSFAQEAGSPMADGMVMAQQVIAAERAFAERALRDGQWTAFRATAAPDALMFVPGPTDAQHWLAGRSDPAQTVQWQPHRVVISCDGTLAATTGAAQWPGGGHGYFTTVWRRQADGGWRWIADHGDNVPAPLAAPATPAVEKAECPGSEGPPAQPPTARGEARGGSPDGTLLWDWVEGQGLRVTMWIGPRYAPTILPGPPR